MNSSPNLSGYPIPFKQLRGHFCNSSKGITSSGYGQFLLLGSLPTFDPQNITGMKWYIVMAIIIVNLSTAIQAQLDGLANEVKDKVDLGVAFIRQN